MRNRLTLSALVSVSVLAFTAMVFAQDPRGTQPKTKTDMSTSQGQGGSQAQSSSTPNAQAGAGTTTPQDQSQTPGQSGTPAATDQQSPSATSPSSSQSSTSTPGTAGAQAGSQAPMANHPGSVEEALQLTNDQKAKLQPIIQEEMSQIEAVRNDTTLSMDQKVAKVRQIKQTEFPKIQAVLTPEQNRKLEQMQRDAAQRQGSAGTQGSGQGSTSQEPPK